MVSAVPALSGVVSSGVGCGSRHGGPCAPLRSAPGFGPGGPRRLRPRPSASLRGPYLRGLVRGRRWPGGLRAVFGGCPAGLLRGSGAPCGLGPAGLACRKAILLPGGVPAPDVPLGLVPVQHGLGLEVQRLAAARTVASCSMMYSARSQARASMSVLTVHTPSASRKGGLGFLGQCMRRHKGVCRTDRE